MGGSGRTVFGRWQFFAVLLFPLSGCCRPRSRRPTPSRDAARKLLAVFHVGLRTILAGRGFRVPFALLVLVLDDLAVSRDSLLRGGRLGGRERVRMSGEGLGKYAVNLVSPAAVVSDDLICHVRH